MSPRLASMPGPASAGWLAEPMGVWERRGVWAVGWAGLLAPSALIVTPHHPGCVRELRIQGEEIVFHDLNLTAHGISHCPTCRDRPCQVTLQHMHPSLPLATAPPPGWPPWEVGESQGLLCLTSGVASQNGGQCQDSESSSYVCICPAGFTGSRCEHSQALHCHPGV